MVPYHYHYFSFSSYFLPPFFPCFLLLPPPTLYSLCLNLKFGFVWVIYNFYVFWEMKLVMEKPSIKGVPLNTDS